MRQRLAKRADTIRQSEASRPGVAPKKTGLFDGMSSDESTSDSDSASDEEVRARRAHDRQIQQQKAQNTTRKKTMKDHVTKDGAKKALGNIKERAKALKAKIKNEEADEDAPKIDGQDAQEDFIQRRRHLFKKLDSGGAGYEANDALTGGKAGASGQDQTMDATVWERNFIRRARNKRTVVGTCAVLIVLALLFVPPFVVYQMDKACDEPEKTRTLELLFDANMVSHIAIVNFRGTVAIVPPSFNISTPANDPLRTSVSVTIVARAVADEALGGVITEAALGLDGTLSVTAAYDGVIGGDFSLWSCPEAHVVVRLPNARYGQDLPTGYQPPAPTPSEPVGSVAEGTGPASNARHPSPDPLPPAMHLLSVCCVLLCDFALRRGLVGGSVVRRLR